MELRQLEYFLTVGRLGSVTKAADLLNVAQPSVSVSIKNLESELGVQLLDRSKKNIALTSEGLIFFQRVEFVLGSLQDAVTEMGDFRTPSKGSLKIGITPIMGALLFPHAFAEFQKRNPDIRITVVEEGSLAIRSQLEKGELDVGVLITTHVRSPLETLPITTGQIHACLSADNPLCEYDRIPFKHLQDQPFILFKEDTYIRQLILEECSKRHFAPRIAFSSSQIGTILGMVAQGVGISFFLEEMIQGHAGVASRPFFKPLILEAGLSWNKKKYMPKTVQAFIDSFRESMPKAAQAAGTT